MLYGWGTPLGFRRGEENLLKILIQPIGEVDKGVFPPLKRGLERVFSGANVVLSEREMPVPKGAFSLVRRQYNSTRVLLEMFRRCEGKEGDKVLGVTSVDLYVPSLNFVFGEAQLLGTGAIISLHRLRPEFYVFPPNQQLFTERIVKEAVHELGHTLGLKHCKNSKCVMSFSNSIRMVDTKDSRFCVECLSRLRSGKSFLVHQGST